MEIIDQRRLASGARLQLGLVRGPNPAWAQHLIPFLRHKPEPYLWQIRTSLQDGFPGLDAWYYVACCDGKLVANITVIARRGVGVLGHVFTLPEYRGQGIASALMAAQMAHFRAHCGRALYLGTRYGQTAYRLYVRNGFASLYPESGAMHWLADPAFYEETFRVRPYVIRPLALSDWGGMCALFGAPAGDDVRSRLLPAHGPTVVEGNFLRLMQRVERGEIEAHVAVSADEEEAVLGLALKSRQGLWPDGRSRLVELYVYPGHEHVLPALDAAIATPEPRITLLDGGAQRRRSALLQLGYRELGRLPQELSAAGHGCDVLIFGRAPS